MNDTIDCEIRYKWYTRTYISPLQKEVAIIEDYIGHGLSLNKISERHNVHIFVIRGLIDKYFKKPKTELTLTSKV